MANRDGKNFSKKSEKISILSQTLCFSSVTPSETSTIRCRIKFCIQHNLKESQHKHTSESYHEKLESGANFTYVPSSTYNIEVESLDVTV